MTDREKWEAFFKSYGLTQTDGYLHETGSDRLVFEANYGKVEGYNGFAAVVKFDTDGKFVEFGVWE